MILVLAFRYEWRNADRSHGIVCYSMWKIFKQQWGLYQIDIQLKYNIYSKKINFTQLELFQTVIQIIICGIMELTQQTLNAHDLEKNM